MFAEGFDGLGKRELVALETGDEAAAAHDAASFKTAKHAEEFAPARHGSFALKEIAEEDAVAPEKDEGGGFYFLFFPLGSENRKSLDFASHPNLRTPRRLGTPASLRPG